MHGESHARYTNLGARDPEKTYVAWWLNRGDVSLVSVNEVVDRPALERCLDDDALGKRLKLLIRAVKCSLPFPSKGPKDADTVGYFFGKGASLTRSQTADGVDVVTVQIDLFSVTILRWALQSVGFRKGNIVDAILVDWPGQAVLASYRLAVTDAFLGSAS
jgi:transposase InsO family protein